MLRAMESLQTSNLMPIGRFGPKDSAKRCRGLCCRPLARTNVRARERVTDGCRRLVARGAPEARLGRAGRQEGPPGRAFPGLLGGCFLTSSRRRRC
jgi:hypothetical protein